MFWSQLGMFGQQLVTLLVTTFRRKCFQFDVPLPNSPEVINLIDSSLFFLHGSALVLHGFRRPPLCSQIVPKFFEEGLLDITPDAATVIINRCVPRRLLLIR